MLTQEDDVEICALKERGWTVSAIARHTGRDRKTIRRYLAGDGSGQGRARAASCLEPYRAYIEARFVDDPHLPAVTLADELAEAGFDRSYPTLVRELRRLELRPVCLVCQQRRGRAPTTEIDHPAGEEIQWDWLELPDTPWGEATYVLVGALSHSGRFRAVMCEQMTFGHLAGAVHEILVGLGGTSRVWRTDRMATAVIPGTGRLNPQFAQMAKHYGVDVAVCPAHRPQRKGVVEAAIRYLGGRWWRTTRAAGLGEAQRSLDRFCLKTSDRRRRRGSTVGELGVNEPLRPLPATAFPARIMVTRQTSRSALVAFEGNRYSVAPHYARRTVTVIAGVGDPVLRIISGAGELIAEHHRHPAGGDQTIRSVEHARLLEAAVLAAFTTQTSCRSKTNRPPGADALAQLARLGGMSNEPAPVISLERYAELAAVAC
jgi:transposase